MIADFVADVLSGDRIIFSFVWVWASAIVIWISLDWVGNPNRGRFRPNGEQVDGTRRERRTARIRQRAEDDAAVRSTLRDAYGSSSLRVTWNRAREAAAIEADEMLVRPDPTVTASPEPTLWTSLPWFRDEFQADEPLLGTWTGDPFVAHPAMPRGRWRRGDDPWMLSPTGRPPTAATVRSRVWKNHAESDAWGAANRDRMGRGRPPRRYNPITGVVEFGIVDLRSARPGWRDDPPDPFAATNSVGSEPGS